MTNPKGLPRASHSGRMLLGDAAVFVHVLPGGAAIVEAATVEALLGLPESGLGAFLASLPGTDRVTFLRSRESCSMCKAPASHYVRETSAKVCGKKRRDIWCPTIDLDTGKILNWPEGTTARLHYKVCDDGDYALLDADFGTVKSINGYVPDIMCPGGGDGDDYVVMTIGADGVIANWRVDLADFEKEDR